MSRPDRDQQLAEAEEILGDRLNQVGLAKGLFFGQVVERLPSYPLSPDEPTKQLVSRLRTYCAEQVDAVAIDRQAKIPPQVIRGLGELGVLGACLPTACGGLGMGQTAYCRLLEVLGGHCGSTALFVNAHHSIGPRAIVLFGTPEQQQRWLPKLATGEWLSAFALTEPEAGSDAGNVQSTATPTEDGQGYKIQGEKRWITNGGIAQVLTVMARTPSPDGRESKITAFLVTPDMPGFRVVEERMEKCGVRGTATSRLAFDDMFVPRENVLGQLGKGLKVALTVLDFGRTTFGASCTGAAKFCVDRAARHANTRVQFGETLGSFELVKEKLAFMQAGAFAMESCTYQTAALIDAGVEDFMLETAMLKVFATDTLWRIVNDTIQIFGGRAYFTDEPYERMMRDARINMIGEGANDVLRVFSALVGMRDVGLELEGVLRAVQMPFGNLKNLTSYAGRKLSALLVPPTIEVRHPELDAESVILSRLIRSLGQDVERLLRVHQHQILERQYQLGRIADAATEIYVSLCVLNRLDAILTESRNEHHSGNHAGNQSDGHDSPRLQLATGRYYLRTATARIRRALAGLWTNDDELTTKLADAVLARDNPASP